MFVSIHRLRRLPLVLLMLAGLLTPLLAVAAVPALPAALKKNNRPTMVEFYATWCMTCQRLRPVVRTIRKKTRGRMNVIRLDIDRKASQPYLLPFRVTGTPSYYFFDKSGRPVYQMNEAINAGLLGFMAYKTAGLLKPVALPKDLASLSFNQHPITLVKIHPKTCTASCREAQAFSKKLQRQFGRNVGVIELESKAPGVPQLMKHFGLKSSPSYALVDRDGYRILQLDAPITDYEKNYIRQFVRMVYRAQL